MPPALGPSIALALRAVARQAWLLAAGAGVALLRRALRWPALAAAWGLVVEAGWLAARQHPFDPLAPLQGALAAVTSARFVAVVGGLWAAGTIAGAALRVAWIAGAVPALGEALAGGEGGPPRFAAGVAYGFPRVLAAAVLGLVAELSGIGFAATLALAAAQAGERLGGAAAPRAALVAFALAVAVAVPVALSAVSEVAVARAALRGDGPGAAFAAAARRFLARPGTFVLALLVFGFAAAAVPVAVEAGGSLATGFAPGAPALVLAGPTLMLAALAAALSAAVDLAWLATAAVLGCADDVRS